MFGSSISGLRLDTLELNVVVWVGYLAFCNIQIRHCGCVELGSEEWVRREGYWRRRGREGGIGRR